MEVSKKTLCNYINDSSDILNKHFIKFLEEEESVNSTINNIKYLLEEQEKNQSLNKKINEFIKEDINISKLRRNMKTFKNGLKGKVHLKTNDLFKSPMISKKIADIINCWDTFSKMNDIHFYKFKNSFIKIYPPLSAKAIDDPYHNKISTQIHFFSPKNKL